MPLLPTLTVNKTFMREFVCADVPCFALGMVEEGQRRCGFVALRPDKVIPREVSDGGFRFGHGMLGNDNFEVLHFAFKFYGFETYNALTNPNNPLTGCPDGHGGKRRLLFLQGFTPGAHCRCLSVANSQQ